MQDTHDEVQSLKSELEAVQNRLKKLAGKVEPEVAVEVKHYVDQASSALKEYVDQTAGTLKEKWGVAKEAGARTGEKVSGYAKENPWHIAAAGALIGMAVASLLGKDREND